ncbi:hypothetical protein JTB14_012526 [Gonioctena quinquepunctata]|nr:hypothetical protein JTB14_012526 [Gonioctena quinquepunctata]
MIGDFSVPENDSAFQKIKSRLIYITYRVQRIAIPNSADEASIRDFKKSCTCRVKALHMRSDVDETPHKSFHPLSLNSTLQIPRTTVVNNLVQKSVPVFKWNLTKFNVNSNALFTFMNKIDELAKSLNVSKDDLSSSAADLFTDKAFIWFKSIESSVKDWGHLVSLLKTYFLPLYFDESTKLKYIRKGILPHYNERLSVVTAPIITIENLLEWCRKIDEGRQNGNVYRAPPKLVYIPS